MRKKQAIKLYHIMWSAITKYLKTTVLVQNRCITLPNFGTFIPDRQSVNNSMMSPRKLTSSNLERVVDLNISLLLNANFAKAIEQGASIHKNNIYLDVDEKEDELAMVATRLNFASIAKACNTDQTTVELIY